MKLKLLFAILLFAFMQNANADKFPAPLGLKYGMSKSEVRGAGVGVFYCEPAKFFVGCEAYDLPKPITYVQMYKLLFINNELHAVGMIGKREDYRRMVKLLTKKYGNADFPYGTSHGWLRSIEPPDVGIQITKDSDGFIIGYQSKEYNQVSEKYQAEQEAKESEGL